MIIIWFVFIIAQRLKWLSKFLYTSETSVSTTTGEHYIIRCNSTSFCIEYNSTHHSIKFFWLQLMTEQTNLLEHMSMCGIYIEVYVLLDCVYLQFATAYHLYSLLCMGSLYYYYPGSLSHTTHLSIIIIISQGYGKRRNFRGD